MYLILRIAFRAECLPGLPVPSLLWGLPSDELKKVCNMDRDEMTDDDQDMDDEAHDDDTDDGG